MRQLAAVPPVALACLLVLAGCGLGAGPAPKQVSMVLTSEFGERVLADVPHPVTKGQETVMSLLLRNQPAVDTRYGGGFVASIAGHSGHEGAKPVDWFYYVNGVEAHKGAAATNVEPGDHIWWDLHDWSQTDDVPAVVGSYPEPFLNGIGGKRLPVRVECVPGTGAEAACHLVTKRLQADGVPAAVSALGSGGGTDILRVLVGPWAALRADTGVASIEQGPRASGVYATFGGHGRTMTLLEADGHALPLRGRSAGLIAATRSGEEAPAWVITGTDQHAVGQAAADFTREDLRDRFALAVLPGSADAVPLPVPREDAAAVEGAGG